MIVIGEAIFVIYRGNVYSKYRSNYHASVVQASASLLSAIIQPRLQDHPTYHPINIKKDTRRDEGVKSAIQRHGVQKNKLSQISMILMKKGTYASLSTARISFMPTQKALLS